MTKETEKKTKKLDIIFFSILAFILILALAISNNTKNKNEKKKTFTKQNLITVQEKIGLSQLLNISGYYLTNNGIYVNKFEEKLYLSIFNMRKEKPNNEKYFFCDVNEFIKISDLFKNNVNNNEVIKNMGNEIIKKNRENCFKAR